MRRPEFEVANRFADGHGVPQSDGEAVRWLELAAKQGLAPAQFRLGAFYGKGIAVKRDLALARDLYAAAAAKGNAKAMHNLAVLYAEGINGPADYRTAAQWFLKAADRGITDSQYNLAILYARGIGVEQNYAESDKRFALAAGKGDGDAAKQRDEVAAHLDAQRSRRQNLRCKSGPPSRSRKTPSTPRRRRAAGMHRSMPRHASRGDRWQAAPLELQAQ